MAYYYYGSRYGKKGNKYGTKYGTVYNAKTLNGALSGAYKLIKNSKWEIIIVRSQSYPTGDEYFVFRMSDYDPSDRTIVYYKGIPGKRYEEHKKYELKSDGTKGKRVYTVGDMW